MSEYQDYKEKKDEYELDENGKYIGDVKDKHLNILMYIFAILVFMIPVAIVESIWSHYLPTGKIILTCLVFGFAIMLYLRVMCFEDKRDEDDKFIWKPRHRKLK